MQTINKIKNRNVRVDRIIIEFSASGFCSSVIVDDLQYHYRKDEVIEIHDAIIFIETYFYDELYYKIKDLSDEKMKLMAKMLLKFAEDDYKVEGSYQDFECEDFYLELEFCEDFTYGQAHNILMEHAGVCYTDHLKYDDE